jgi:hypothetical protein
MPQVTTVGIETSPHVFRCKEGRRRNLCVYENF